MNKISIKQGNCMDFLPLMAENSVNFTLTDIPYDEVNRKSNGLRSLDKAEADILTFNLLDFCEQVYRVTANSLCIFCGRKQFSDIYSFFNDKEGTAKPIVWEKTNPSPMNGQNVYLNGIELGVWFKKKGAKVFNAHCKNPVFKYPVGRSKLHPTEKNHLLLQDLILDNTNEGDIVFDPCMGSGSHGVVAVENGRKFIGYELNSHYFDIAVNNFTQLMEKLN